jgi:hypothetical protein
MPCDLKYACGASSFTFINIDMEKNPKMRLFLKCIVVLTAFISILLPVP